MCAKCKRIDCICKSICKHKLNIFETCAKCETLYQRWLNEPFFEGKSRREFYELQVSVMSDWSQQDMLLQYCVAAVSRACRDAEQAD